MELTGARRPVTPMRPVGTNCKSSNGVQQPTVLSRASRASRRPADVASDFIRPSCRYLMTRERSLVQSQYRPQDLSHELTFPGQVPSASQAQATAPDQDRSTSD